MDKAFCPYRVCPIGAHIDHQFGPVTGFAIDKGIEIEFKKNNDGKIRIDSAEFSKHVEFELHKFPEKQHDWANYLRGAAVALEKEHHLSYGIDAYVRGSLPIGGLSSSAAVIISFLSALCKANSIRLSQRELINMALWAETEYVGVSVGKLDQSCEVLCKKDHLLYLDTKDDFYEIIPQNDKMKPFEIIIIFSGVERNLIGSKYNMRVDELKSAAYALKAFSGMEYGKFEDTRLRDVPKAVFDEFKDRLPENWRKRAEHYYSEVDRVKKGAESWRNGDIETFGRLSFESGYSSIYKYETGSEELKKIYEIMLETEGVYGGRFSGAGFKGCCMAIVNPEYKEQIKHKITKEYLNAFPNLEKGFGVYFCNTADGVDMY